MWDEASPQLSTILEGVLELAEPVVPFDAASDVPIDDQKWVYPINVRARFETAMLTDGRSILLHSNFVHLFSH